ncbi:MAG: NAD(P)-dependent oxidoreductase [Caldisericia bacterium]|nr:NAD(P)-dependent oxidoreductase [Caldisericia bacterium]MDD4614124.1 NAD(P)-dependent oxidoreductase [Caldisericia bacterium]
MNNQVGFIGYGNLGKAMIQRLSEKKTPLLLWNRSIDALENSSLPYTNKLSALGKQCQHIFINVFDSSAVRDILQELLPACKQGHIIIDTTTNHFTEVLPFFAMCKERKVDYLESPVLGSVIPASKGMLTTLVSGNEDAYETIRPLLSILSRHIYYLAEPGLASKMKIINNLCLGSFMATLAESIHLGESIGLPLSKVLEILGNGGGDSLVLRAKAESIEKGNFEAQFSNACMKKDLNLVTQLSQELNHTLFTATAAKNLYTILCNENMEDKDFSSLYQYIQNVNKLP